MQKQLDKLQDSLLLLNEAVNKCSRAGIMLANDVKNISEVQQLLLDAVKGQQKINTLCVDQIKKIGSYLKEKR